MFFNPNQSDNNNPNNTNDNTNQNTSSNTDELNVNKEKREYYESLMKKSSTQLDGYWDKNNPFVKLLLLVLLGIIVFGVIYYYHVYTG